MYRPAMYRPSMYHPPILHQCIYLWLQNHCHTVWTLPCHRQQSNAMIIQYHISVYRVEFLCQPPFSAFHLRVINSHNHHVIDTQRLHSAALGNQVFPLTLRLKGPEQVDLRVKVVWSRQQGNNYGEGEEICYGQGGCSIGIDSAGQTRSVTIYDRSVGSKMVGLCVVDLLVSGHTAKHASKETTQSRVPEVKKEQENEVLSCMSYTVESGHSQSIGSVPNNAIKVQKVKDEDNIFVREESKAEVSHLSKYNFIDDSIEAKKDSIKQSSSRKHSLQDSSPQQQEEGSQLSQLQSNKAAQKSEESVPPLPNAGRTLTNIAYLSRKTQPLQYKRQLFKAPLVEQRSHHLKPPSPGKEVPSAASISQRVEQSQKLMLKLKEQVNKYSQNGHIRQAEQQKQSKKHVDEVLQTKQLPSSQKQSNPNKVSQPSPQKPSVDPPSVKLSLRPLRHKRRLPQIKQSSPFAYHTDLDFITYHNNTQQQPCSTISNISILNNQTQGTIQELSILYRTYQKCATVHHKNYVDFCGEHGLQPGKVSVRVPEQERSFFVVVATSDGGFQGVVENKVAGSVRVPLRRVQGRRLGQKEEDSWWLCFSLIGASLGQQGEEKEEVVDTLVEELVPVRYRESIRLRVKTESSQPWSYGQSHQPQRDSSSCYEKEEGFREEGMEPGRQCKEDKENKQGKNVSASPVILQLKPQQEQKPQEIAQVQEQVLQVQEKTVQVQYKTLQVQQKTVQTDAQKKNKKKKNPQKQSSSMAQSNPSSKESQHNRSISLRMEDRPQLSSKPQSQPSHHSRTSSLKPANSGREDGHRNDIREINRLRNGNRNNYRFKEGRSNEKQGQVRELWERLLLRKKVQQDQLQLANNSIKVKETYFRPKVEQKGVRRQTQTIGSQKQRSLGSISNQRGQERSRDARLYSYTPGTREVEQVGPSELQQTIYPSRYPLRSLTLTLNNISICQSQQMADSQADALSGKFLKLSMADKSDKRTYFTEIILNSGLNSILWKLSGCIFDQLSGMERVVIELYSAVGHRSRRLGAASIRVSKLFFLRNNHVYNGYLMERNHACCQFFIGFLAEETIPFGASGEQHQGFRADNLTHQGHKGNHLEKEVSRRSVSLRNRVRQGKMGQGQMRRQSQQESMSSGTIMNETLKYS